MLNNNIIKPTIFRPTLSRRAIDVAVWMLAGFSCNSRDTVITQRTIEELAKHGMEVKHTPELDDGSKSYLPKTKATFRANFIKHMGL